MTRGDCERAVAAAARVDGIDLVPVGRSIGWLTQRGHLDLPENLSEPREHLAAIFEALSGDLTAQAAKRSIPLPRDLIHVATSTLVEVDEYQHFTTFRRTTLDLYPPECSLNFDLDGYRNLCDRWCSKADRYRKGKAAPGFGEAGRQRQRAYNDALRDLAAAPMGYPLIQVDAAEGDGQVAYERIRKRLLAVLG